MGSIGVVRLIAWNWFGRCTPGVRDQHNRKIDSRLGSSVPSVVVLSSSSSFSWIGEGDDRRSRQECSDACDSRSEYLKIENVGC